MLIDFIKGKSKILTGEMLLDLFTAEFRSNLDPQNISTKAHSYSVDCQSANTHRYGICHKNSMHDTWIFFVDEEAKIIIANPDSLLNIFNTLRLIDGTGKCIDKLGEYRVFDYFNIVDEINDLYEKIDEEVIYEHKDNIISEIGELVRNKKRTRQVQDIKGKIDILYKICYVQSILPNLPTILERLDKQRSTYSVAHTILNYILDAEMFIKQSKVCCEKSVEFFSSKIYECFEARKKISAEKHDARLTIIKNVLSATKDIHEDVNIITIDGEKKKVKTDYHFDHFNTSDDKGLVYLDNIKTIFYKRKIIYQKDE